MSAMIRTQGQNALGQFFCIKKSYRSRQRRQNRGCILKHIIKVQKRTGEFLSTASYSARTRRYSMKH